MLKIDVLFDVVFGDIALTERIPKIAKCGYKYLETWKGGDAAEMKSIGEACKTSDMELVSIVMNFATEEQVAPINPDNKQRFLEQMDRYSDNALSAGCKQGIVTTGQSITGLNYQQQRIALIEALREAGELVGKKGFKLNLEPLNTKVDHPGYFLDCPQEAVAIVKEVALDNVKILFDVYHMEIMRGNQTIFIKNNIDWIGHFHSAGVPGRHEVFNGETNYPFIIDAVEKSGYEGYFGLEYMPLLESDESLRKTLKYLQQS